MIAAGCLGPPAAAGRVWPLPAEVPEVLVRVVHPDRTGPLRQGVDELPAESFGVLGTLIRSTLKFGLNPLPRPLQRKAGSCGVVDVVDVPRLTALPAGHIRAPFPVVVSSASRARRAPDGCPWASRASAFRPSEGGTR